MPARRLLLDGGDWKCKESSLFNTKCGRNVIHFVDLRTHKNETAAEGQQPADGVSTFFKILLPGLRSNNDPHYSKELAERRNDWIDVR